MKELKIAAAIFITASVICFIVSGFLFFRTKNFIKGAVQTEGTVIDVSHKSTGSGSFYSPVVKYFTKDKEEIIFHSKSGSNRPDFKTGERVRVLYNPEDGQDARIVSFFQLWGGTFILFCVGFGTGLLGAGFSFMASRFRGK